ncbi:MAG TPA: tetratricopeptide repeat protein [Holophaga sp.]|nr:tetratricopeptide repeat protein [Holophaga sp.]HPS68509.1 tetratricopeptide repeat protein [Holophaga sp.]
MDTEIPGTYCQNCFTWNPGERETCRKCGTRLLIVTGDQGWEEEESDENAGDDLDEHLLERITGLEENLRRIETYLETVSDQLGRLERSEVMLRNGLMSLVQQMEERGQLDGQAFSTRWEELVEENLQLISARELFTRYRARILPIAKPRSMSQLRRALLETSALLDSAQLAEAAQRLAQALALDPKNYELVFTVAALKEVAQDFEESENLAKRVVQLSPRHFEAWMLLAKVLKDEPGRVDEAIEALRKAIELRPDEAEPKIQLCELLLDEEDLQGALEAAGDALNIQRDGDTLSLMGEVLLARGEAAKAVAVLKEASGHVPGDLMVRELLAEGYILGNERAKAFSILEDLLRQHPGDPDLLLLLDAENPAQLRSARGGKAEARFLLDDAEDWLKEGNLAEAEVALKKARRKDQSERADWIELQIAAKRHTKTAIPKALTFAASSRHPRLCFQALRLAVDPLMEQENEAAIMKALDTFLKAHPKSSGAWEAAIIRQAYRLMNGKVGQEDLAEVRRLQASPLPGQEARARTLLGQYLMEMRKPEEVVELIEPVLKSEPTIINHFQLGTALAALGEREDALQTLQDGLEAVPGDLAEAQVNLLKSKMQALVKDLEKTPEAST